MPTPLFLAGESLPAAKLQQLGDDDNYTPSIEATTTNPDLGTDPLQDGLIWQNGNHIEMWFRIQIGSAPSAGSGTYEILLPAAYPLADSMFDGAIGEVRLVDVSGSSEKVAILIADGPGNRAIMRVCDDSSLVTAANPWVPAAGDLFVGRASWLTGDVTGGGGGGGGGGGNPPPATHQVDFRSLTDPLAQAPVVTPTLADIEHPSGGTIYAGGTGTTHIITSSVEWNSAVAAATPGDILKITASITSELTYRGDKYGITGGTAADGAAGNPIVIGCEGAGIIDVASISGNSTCLEVFNVDHVWCVEVKTDGGQFGIYYRNVEGAAANPARIARCSISDTGHAALTIAGWFQLIASSVPAVPPAGAGNEWGFSRHILVEGNDIARPGRADTQFGECVYLGNGNPSWTSHAKDITLRYNILEECTADYIDIKPGCSRVNVLDNIMKKGAFVFGSAIQCLYVSSGIAARPAWYLFDPEIVIEGNRCWDGDITNTVASSSNFFIQTSLAGVRVANNIAWGFRTGAIGVRLRSEHPESETQAGTEKFVVINNLFWMSEGLANAGAPLSTPSPFYAAKIDARNNIGLTGTTTGVEATAVAADFIDPAAIPTIHTVDADAEWETYGPGSAFDLDPGSSLVATGSDIADVALAIAEDISQRVVPSPSPNPGPFQEHPANA
jgi:hypothetical protein